MQFPGQKRPMDPLAGHSVDGKLDKEEKGVIIHSFTKRREPVLFMFSPSLKEFLRSSEPVPIYKRIPTGHPDLLTLARTLNNTPTVLLESVKRENRTGRYSFLAMDPFLTLESKGTWMTLTQGERITRKRGNPLRQLSSLLARFHVPRPEGLPPFFGGAAGYFSYDLVHLSEILPCTTVDDLHLPDLSLAFFETVVAVDHAQQETTLIFCPVREQFAQGNRSRLYHRAVNRLEELESWIRSVSCNAVRSQTGDPGLPAEISSTLSSHEFIERVHRCQAYISAGDIFQANLSLRFSVETRTASPFDLYQHLRSINPAPFAACLDLGQLKLISSSPERLVRVDRRSVETRPIAGTRPRGSSPEEDERMVRDLLTSAKERAEHLMLVDLERNDLGRVCQYGSVKVDEFMVTERYSHVMHIVSNIQGQLRHDQDCVDVLQAVFPGGTVTGVPKVRCMEIIDELEPVARGPYTGSIGYISFAGDMDLNIIIRSLAITRQGIHVQVGSGIVADSDPQREYEECLYKAEAMLKAIQIIQ